jgi:hypothetical protein
MNNENSLITLSVDKVSISEQTSFPQAKRVGNPSSKKDSGQAGMTHGLSL